VSAPPEEAKSSLVETSLEEAILLARKASNLTGRSDLLL
jgi:hypothetical protein